MTIGDQLMTALLLVQLALATAALGRAGYFGFKALRETTFAKLLPYPTLTLSTSGKVFRHKLASWLGMSVTVLVVPWLLLLVGYSLVSPPSPTNSREFTVVVSRPGGQRELLGPVRGSVACGEKAAQFARAHGIFDSDWGYQCCLKDSPSECEPRAW